MPNLEIVTAHNIIINNETAELNKRVLATIIDYILIGIIFSILNGLAEIHISLHYLLAYPFVVFYHLIFEIFNNGQSIGKKVLKLKVVSLDGGNPTLEESILRWVFRVVDVVGSFGILGSLMISSTQKNQRLGDLLANTTVINLSDHVPVTFEGIEKIPNQTNVDLSFPKLAQFEDADFLFVKRAINRYESNKSSINRKIISTLAQSIAEKIDANIDNKNNIDFLKQVLREYILLTR